MKKLLVLLAVAAVVGFAPVAFADNGSGSLTVTANIQNECMVGTSAVSFGQYSYVDTNLTTDLTGTGNINLTCTTGAAPKIVLGVGSAGEGTAHQRQMSDGAGTPHLLSYNLYTSAAKSTVWLSTTSAVASGLTGDGSAHDMAIYGTVPQAQNKPAGSYEDDVPITVSF